MTYFLVGIFLALVTLLFRQVVLFLFPEPAVETELWEIALVLSAVVFFWPLLVFVGISAVICLIGFFLLK